TQTISPAPEPREPDRAQIVTPSNSSLPTPRDADQAEILTPRISLAPTQHQPDRQEVRAPPISPAPTPAGKETTVSSGGPAAASRWLDQEEISVLLKRGKDLMADGDLIAARLVLQRAAEANDAEAALALAATYDPFVLRKLKVYGVSADAAM